MNGRPSDMKKFDKIHQWVTKLLEGSATDSEQHTLQDAVTNDVETRHEYIRYMQEMAHIASRLVHPEPSNWISKSKVLELSDDEAPESHDRLSNPELPSSASGLANPRNILRNASGMKRSDLRFFSGITIAAGVMLVASLATWNGFQAINDRPDVQSVALRPPSPSAHASHQKVEVATLLESTDVVWDTLRAPVEELSRITIGQELCIHHGTIKIVFDCGVEALVLAPCKLQLRDRDRLFCTYGRITAKASRDGRGFVIETPLARVTDLGTEFGIAISDSGETEVAVFEGAVDVEHTPLDSLSSPEAVIKLERLVQGQATRVGPSGSSSRVFSIDNRRMPGVRDSVLSGASSPVISSVRDNISERNPESRMFYRIVQDGFREDCRAFIDRFHQWNGLTDQGLPEMLIGADYVMPFNDDKFAEDLRVQVAIAKPATVYVIFSNNTQVPEWLSTEFVDTGMDIGLDEGPGRYKPKQTLGTGPAASIDTTFSLWKQEVNEPREIELGSFERPDDVQSGYNMYGIAAVAHQ